MYAVLERSLSRDQEEKEKSASVVTFIHDPEEHLPRSTEGLVCAVGTEHYYLPLETRTGARLVNEARRIDGFQETVCGGEINLRSFRKMGTLGSSAKGAVKAALRTLTL